MFFQTVYMPMNSLKNRSDLLSMYSTQNLDEKNKNTPCNLKYIPPLSVLFSFGDNIK